MKTKILIGREITNVGTPDRVALLIAMALGTINAQAANIAWTGASGVWNDAANWTSNPLLPASSDDVFINALGTHVVTFNAGTATVHSITMTGDDRLAITGGDLGVVADATLRDFTQSAGSFASQGTVTVTGNALLSGGLQYAPGTTRLAGSTVVNGIMDLDQGRTLQNAATGALTLNSGFIRLGASGGNTLQNDGLLVASGDGAGIVVDGPSGGAFNNAGTFLKSGSSAGHVTQIRSPFNNVGRVEVQTGVLSLQGGGSHSGQSSLAPGTTLRFDGGVHMLDAASNIDGAGATLAVVSGAVNAGGALAVDRFVQSGGEFTAGTSYSFTNLAHTGGTLAGTGDITVTGDATLTGGRQEGPGTTRLQGAGSIGGSLELDAGRILHNAATGVLTLTDGSVNVDSSQLAGSGTLQNDGLFVVSGDAAGLILRTGSGGAFNNAGIFRKTGSAAGHVSEVRAVFNNAGTVDVQTGELKLSGGGTHTGNFDLAPGTTLSFGFEGGRTQTLDASSRVIGAGSTLSVTGLLNANGTIAVEHYVQSSGSFIATNNYSFTSLTHSGGVLGGSGDITVTGNASLGNGTQIGAATTHLQGAGDLSSAFALDAGRVLHNAANASLTWTAGALNLDSSTVTGSGTLRNDGLFVASGDGAALMMQSGRFGESGNFINTGTFRKAGSSAGHVSEIRTRFQNSGTVDVQSGTLSLTAGGTHTGVFNLAAGTTLDFGLGTHTLDAASSIVGADATLSVTSSNPIAFGTVNANGTIAVGNYHQSAGRFIVGGSLTVTDAVHTGGTLGGTGDLVVTGNATLGGGTVVGTSVFGGATQTGPGITRLQGTSIISGVKFAIGEGRTLHNAATGTVDWNAAAINLNTGGGTAVGTLHNDGLFVASGDAADLITQSSFGGTFRNAGTFRKTGSAVGDVTTIVTAFENSGTVDVRTGVLALDGPGFSNDGTIGVAAGATFRKTGGSFTNNGTLTGNGTFDSAAALTNAGVIDPGTGIGSLTVAGGLTQTATGLFDIDLGSLSSFDTVSILGDVNFDGTLRISSLGGYNPNGGDSFTLITFDDGVADASDRSGVFDALVWSGFDPGISFTAVYLDHAVVLTANVNAVPVPPAIWLFGSGVLGLVGVARRRPATATARQ